MCVHVCVCMYSFFPREHFFCENANDCLARFTSHTTTTTIIRNYDTVYEVLLIEYDSWPYGVRVVLQYIGTVAFGALLFLGLL